ncbi:hypothetical protein [Rugosimonospora acidiphila]
MRVDHDAAPSGFDAILCEDGDGDGPSRGPRRAPRAGVLLAVCLLVVGGLTTATVVVVGNFLNRAQWTNQPPPAPHGAIPGVPLSSALKDLQRITGARLTAAAAIHAGHNRRTVTAAGHQLTVDVVPLSAHSRYLSSASCEYHTDGPQSVDAAMVALIQSCMFALVPDILVTSIVRPDLISMASRGYPDPWEVGFHETLTFTDDASTYGVVATGR